MTIASRKQNLLVFFACAVLSILSLLPQLFVTDPYLMDDGVDYMNSKDSFSAILHDYLFVNQRTWPLRVMYRKVLFMFFGMQIGYHFFVNAVLLTAVAFLFHLVVRNIASLSVSLIGILVLFTIPSVYSNTYRLGTSEILVSIVILGSLYCYLTRRFLLCSLILLTGLFIKETVFFYMIVFGIFFVPVQHAYLGVLSFIWAGLYAVIILSKIRSGGLYIAQSVHPFSEQLNLLASAYNFNSRYFSYLGGGVCILLYNTSRGISKNRVGLLLLALSVGSVFPMALWNYSQEYYWMPVSIVTLIFVLHVLHQWYSGIKNRFLVNAVRWIFPSFIILFVITSFPKIIDESGHLHRMYISTGPLVRFLMSNDFTKYHVYYLDWNYAFDTEMSFFVNKFNSQNVDYHPSQAKWVNSLPDDYPTMYDEVSDAYNLDEDRKILLYPFGADIKCHDTYQAFCGRSPFMKSSCSYAVCTDADVAFGKI
jgi:hypothetical protein